eukprot:PITA_21370
MEKYKAHFVARGFSHKEGIVYDEIFAPVARYTTIRAIIALATSQGWNLHQMDAKTAFLHGLIKEEDYVEKLEGFETYDRKYHLGFIRSEADPNLFFKVEDEKPLILVLYVEDLFLTDVDPLILKCKRDLASKFEMKDLGLMHYFLALEVWQKLGETFLSQGKYVVKMLKRFAMMDCKLVTTSRIFNFRSYMVVMSDQIWEMPLSFKNSFALMFLVNLRPNICFAVIILSSYLVEPH